MSNLFNGLESMGLQGLENVKIYDDEPKKQIIRQKRLRLRKLRRLTIFLTKHISALSAKRNLKPKWLEQVRPDL